MSARRPRMPQARRSPGAADSAFDTLKRAYGPRRTKYRAVPTVVDGFRFASKREAARYRELVLLGLAGQIRNLELQPRFPLHVDGVQVAVYVADFRYEERCVHPLLGTIAARGRAPLYLWRDVVEDVKGMATLPLYRLKAKMLAAQYGIVVRETR